MPLNIKNAEVEALINEVVGLTGESKTEAVRKALLERKAKLSLEGAESKKERLRQFLNATWSQMPDHLLGKGVSQEEQDELLGYGSKGV